MRVGICTFLILPLLLNACASSPSRFPASESGRPSPIVFMSDFGTDGDGVAIVKGIILGLSPEAKVVDLTHQVPAFSVKEAARLLHNTAAAFPKGTVFLSLVDRHSQGPRRGIVLKSKAGQYFVNPDNGLVTLVSERDGVEEVREVARGPWAQTSAGSSAHAWRDVYAPIAAHLSKNEEFQNVGPVLTKFTKLDLKSLRVDEKGIKGEVVALDLPFGNLITNITSASLLTAGYGLSDEVKLFIGTKEYKIPFVKTFDDVPVGQMLTYIDSTDHVAVAINQGNFASKNKIKVGTKVSISKAPKKKE